MTTLFISDLHLDPRDPINAEDFLQLLGSHTENTDALYILGDLFEVWIGDDDYTPFNKAIIAAIRQLSDAGIPVYFMHGNRDFLIGHQFAENTGCHLLPDPYVIDLYGRRALLMHGDTLCIEDKKYMEARKTLRNPTYQKIFLSFPLFLRRYIASQFRKASQKHTQNVISYTLDAVDSEIQRIMQEYQVELLIHGHTHQPCIELFEIKGHTMQRVVLSDWHHGAHALEYFRNGELRLVTY